MIFEECPLQGAFIITPEKLEDHRGFFARTWCDREAAERKISTSWVQSNVSFNSRQGTLRGMHYQTAPAEETKLVRCTRGAIWDVIVDIRPESATYRNWFALELNESNRTMLYIPGGFAHGFLTLANDTEVFYLMSEYYHPEYAAGLAWNDPSVQIQWPEADYIMSDKDAQLPHLR